MLQQQRGSSKKGLRRSDIRDMFKDDTSDWELAVRNVYSTITDTRALAAAGSVSVLDEMRVCTSGVGPQLSGFHSRVGARWVGCRTERQ